MRTWMLLCVCATPVASAATPAAGAPGDTCSQPLVISLPGAGLPYVTSGTTCGHGNDYSATCLGQHDQGEDVIYRLEVTAALLVQLRLEGATNGGLALSEACPGGAVCLSVERGIPGTTTELRMDADLEPGVYYLMVDSGPGTTCTDYALTISELPPLVPGDSCALPLVIAIPAQLPYYETGQYTCGRHDFHNRHDSCLSEYNFAEELVYQLVVSEEVGVQITMDPHGTVYSSLSLSLAGECPDGPVCIDRERNENAQPRVLECLWLPPGVYSLVVDGWETPGCVPELDLAIELCDVDMGACCQGMECAGNTDWGACYRAGGTWYRHQDCGPFVCPIQIPYNPETCATAYEVPGVPFSARLFNYTATASPPAGSCNSETATVMQNDVWLRWTAPADTQMTLRTLYEYNGLVALYEGADCDALVELACANSLPQQPDEDEIVFAATGGATYWVQVGDFGVNPGGGHTLVAFYGPAGLPGDANCDGQVGFADINAFVLLLANPPAWQAAYPDCPMQNGDVSGDGQVNFGDINPFVALLAGGG